MIKKIALTCLRCAAILFIVLLLGIVVWIVLVFFQSCKNNTKMIDSPDNKYVASLTYTGCGIINNDYFTVSILKRNHLTLPPWGKDVFVVSNGSSLKTTWINPELLEISGQCDLLQIITQEDGFGKVKIKYQLVKEVIYPDRNSLIPAQGRKDCIRKQKLNTPRGKK